MKLLLVGDFKVGRSSGYAVILENIALQLADKHDVIVLGLNWDKREHNYPFRVIPTDFSWLPVQIMRLTEALGFDHVIMAMDVPKMALVQQEIERQGVKWPPTSGLFPIESDPVLPGWGLALEKYHRLFVISEYGREKLGEVGLESVHLPMTAKALAPEIPQTEARARLRDLVNWGDRKLLEGPGPFALTVADNQERKDLPIIAQALTYLRDEHGLLIPWLLVTTIESGYGWVLGSLWEQLWIHDQVLMFQDLEPSALGWAYRAADVFVLASQAEGACLPLYEAMAHGLVCVAPNHTAIVEALKDGRGELVTPSWWTIHPWGNVNRWHTDPEELASRIRWALTNGKPEAGLEFVAGRSWKDAAVRIEEALDV